jgi:Gpi18-like mannosyltransferase
MEKLLHSKVLLLFLTWRIYILLLAFFAIVSMPLAGRNFLGGGLENYLSNPLLFSWANFDGEHYLSISQIGYRGLEQAFFPVYPHLMRFLAAPFGNTFTASVVTGLFISNVSFVFALYFLYKLLRLDFSHYLSLLTILVLITFPTSFYFGAVYSESLFLLLTILSFYLARKDHWLLASIVGAVASATRIFGLLLLGALLLEALQKRTRLRKYFWIIFIPVGLALYILYQWMSTGDPLAFYNLQKLVGPQHESGITLIPQVYVRYIKMLFSVEFTNPIYQTIFLEFFVGLLFFFLPIYGYFKKVRLSYILFALVGFLLPTIQGSLSSVPRYVLVLFPSFLILAMIINKFPKFLQGLLLVLSSIWMSVEVVLFLRGYWVA